MIRISRNDELGVVMIQTLGNFAFGTLEAELANTKIKITERGSNQRVLGPLPFAMIGNASGEGFLTPQAALAHVVWSSRENLYAVGGDLKPLSAALSLIDTKLDTEEFQTDYVALFESALD